MKTLQKIPLLLLFIIWMLPGLIGRDPWKADEPYSFSITTNIMRTGDAVVPMIAGVPFLEKPPLYYVTAAVSGWLFSPILAQHDAVRVVNLLWMFLTLLFLGLTTRETSGIDAAWTAPILLVGCTLLQMPAHKLVTDVAMLTGFTVAYYGIAISRRLPGWGGLWTGAGICIGFLTKGLFAPGVIGVTVLALPIVFPAWRTREYFRSLVIAAAAALPWLIIWPLALYHRSPEYFIEWFWYQNLGRFFGFARGGGDSHLFHIINLPWLTWPVLLLALWTLWSFRDRRPIHPIYQLPLTAFLVMLTVLILSSSAREIYALPLLLPLVMIAGAGMEHIPDRAAGAITRITITFFGLLGLIIWLLWSVHITGDPAWMQSLPVATVHYAPVDAVLLAAAIIISLVWAAAMVFISRWEATVAVSWSAGVILIWGLIMTLWLPWMEAETSFRDVFTSLREKLPERSTCVASYGIGESERAMLEYYAGVSTRPIETLKDQPCDLLIVGLDRHGINYASQRDWKVLWEGTRPFEHPKEHYTLYQIATPRGGPGPVLTPRSIRSK
jgi:4-amino-4-deoxy-L-arabinose transferase-like glycosyltransferase